MVGLVDVPPNTIDSVVRVLSASAPPFVREFWITVRIGKVGSDDGIEVSWRARARLEARRVLRSVWALLWEVRDWRAEGVAGLRSKGGIELGWKRGARNAWMSDQARESDAACFDLDGKRSGSGNGSIKQLIGLL